jgi:hypothetical protein
VGISCVEIESLLPAKQALRTIKAFVNDLLAPPDAAFERL